MITQECSALYVHESLSPSILNVTPRTDHVESLSVKIRIGTTQLYLSPTCKPENFFHKTRKCFRTDFISQS